MGLHSRFDENAPQQIARFINTFRIQSTRATVNSPLLFFPSFWDLILRIPRSWFFMPRRIMRFTASSAGSCRNISRPIMYNVGWAEIRLASCGKFGKIAWHLRIDGAVLIIGYWAKISQLWAVHFGPKTGRVCKGICTIIQYMSLLISIF